MIGLCTPPSTTADEDGDGSDHAEPVATPPVVSSPAEDHVDPRLLAAEESAETQIDPRQGAEMRHKNEAFVPIVPDPDMIIDEEYEELKRKQKEQEERELAEKEEREKKEAERVARKKEMARLTMTERLLRQSKKEEEEKRNRKTEVIPGGSLK